MSRISRAAASCWLAFTLMGCAAASPAATPLPSTSSPARTYGCRRLDLSVAVGLRCRDGRAGDERSVTRGLGDGVIDPHREPDGGDAAYESARVGD